MPSFVIFNKDECSIEINTADQNLNGLSFGMIFTVKDISGNEIVSRFNLALEDICEEADLIGAFFVDSEATVDIFAPISLEISKGDIGAECGAFTYELLDGKTGSPLTPPILSIDLGTIKELRGNTLPAVVGSIPSRDPYLTNSPMLLQIKTTVEKRTKAALSSLFTLNLRDPCLTTDLEQQDLEDMATT